MLKAGMWIAQGPETNILILLTGTEPMLEVIGGIDLNYFNATGKAKELTKASPEIQDILMYPDKYTFAKPSITDAIQNAVGLGDTSKFEGLGEDSGKREKMVTEALAYYKSALPLYGLEQAKVKTKLHIRSKYNLKMSQANYIYTLVCKMLNRPE